MAGVGQTGPFAAVIVAHPDDEMIWCGGMILRHRRWDWTVVSLCRASDADRQPKFRNVCGLLGARAVIHDVDDSNPPADLDAAVEIGGPIRESLSGRTWELLLTHGAGGEYGHPRHRQVHAEVLRLVREDHVRCRMLRTFACDCEAASGACRPMPDADTLLDLTADELTEKKRIVREVYGYAEDSFEVTACISPEAFVTIGGSRSEGATP